MDTCQYCQKIIQDGEEVKTFRSQKQKKCHLECYINQKLRKKKLIPRAVWKATPNEVCPYCQKTIEDGEEIKTFRSQKQKKCHLECYKNKPGRSWWNLLEIIAIIAMLCLLILAFVH